MAKRRITKEMPQRVLPLPDTVKPLRRVRGCKISQGEHGAVASGQRQRRPIAIFERVLVLERISPSGSCGQTHAEAVCARLRIRQGDLQAWRTIADKCEAVGVAFLAYGKALLSSY